MDGRSATHLMPSPRNSVDINAIVQGTQPRRAVEQGYVGGGRIQVLTTGEFSGMSAEQMSRNLTMLEA